MKFAHYHTLLSIDPELATLVKAVINNEARYVSAYPYCGWRSFLPRIHWPKDSVQVALSSHHPKAAYHLRTMPGRMV